MLEEEIQQLKTSLATEQEARVKVTHYCLINHYVLSIYTYEINVEHRLPPFFLKIRSCMLVGGLLVFCLWLKMLVPSELL